MGCWLLSVGCWQLHTRGLPSAFVSNMPSSKHSSTPRYSVSSGTTNTISGGSDGDNSSVFSAVSVTSSYRHHNTGPFMPSAAASSLSDQPKPVLSKDVHHTPKTTGSFGVLVVGLGGANGCTLLAGTLANRFNLEWFGPRGEAMYPNWYGCISQLKQKGGGVGYNDRVRGLANASMAAVGGWVSSNCDLRARRNVVSTHITIVYATLL